MVFKARYTGPPMQGTTISVHREDRCEVLGGPSDVGPGTGERAVSFQKNRTNSPWHVGTRRRLLVLRDGHNVGL